MAIIGEFTRTETGFSGHIRTLVLDHQLVLIPLDTASADEASDYPAFRIHLSDEGGSEVGAVWKRTGQGATGYNLVLDDPSFAQPIRAHLFATDDDGRGWAVRWIRPKKQDEQD